MPLGIIKRMPPPPLIIWFAGESNSGGLADNSYGTLIEREPRNIKILNNTTLETFDALDVGTNNLVDHVGLNYVQALAHGWEVQIANRYDAHDFGARTVYIVKTGQGGTTINMWQPGNTYSAEAQTIEPFATAVERMEAAIHLVDSIHGKMPQIVMLWSLGINDMGIATDPDVYKDEVQAVFTQLRSAIGVNFPIIQTQFQEIDTDYDTKITEISAALDDVYYISTEDAETSIVVDGVGTHWGYYGMKQIADDMVDLILSILNN